MKTLTNGVEYYYKDNLIIFYINHAKKMVPLFLRMLEYQRWHEVYKYKEKIDLKEFHKWFKLFNGNKQYHELFYGLFFPHILIKKFFNTYDFTTLNPDELKLYKMLKNEKIITINPKEKIKFKKINFILVNNELCVLDGYDPAGVLNHELSHYFYYKNIDYREKVIDTFKALYKKDRLEYIDEYLDIDYSFYLDDETPEITDICDEWCAVIISEKKKQRQLKNAYLHKPKVLKKINDLLDYYQLLYQELKL